MDPSQIVVIIPVFNRLEDLKKFKRKHFKECKIIFVDDSSTDGSLEYIKNNFSNDFIIQTENKDSFWGGAIDCGINFIKKNASHFKGFKFYGYMNIDVKLNTENDFIFNELSNEKIYFIPHFWKQKNFLWPT